MISGGSRGGGSGRSGPPLSDLTLTTLRLKFLDRQDRVSLLNWLIVLMKRAWHFSTKLNARNIKKCNCFWVPSYDLFASARKAVFLEPTATGVHRLRNTWSSLLSQLVDKYGDNSADNHVLSTSEIENETANGGEAEVEAMEYENGERCFMLLFHFLRNVPDCGLDKMHVRFKHLYVCCFGCAF